MAEDSKDRVLRVLERAGIPVAAVLYSLTTAVQLRDALDKLGFRIASILLLALCAAWTVCVWTAKRPNLLDRRGFECVDRPIWQPTSVRCRRGSRLVQFGCTHFVRSPARASLGLLGEEDQGLAAIQAVSRNSENRGPSSCAPE